MNKMGLVGKKKCKDNVLRTVVRVYASHQLPHNSIWESFAIWECEPDSIFSPKKLKITFM